VPFSHSPVEKISIKLTNSSSSETEKGFVFQYPSESDVQSTVFQSNTPTGISLFYDFIPFGSISETTKQFCFHFSFIDRHFFPFSFRCINELF
jgi:hypothetical protein